MLLDLGCEVVTYDVHADERGFFAEITSAPTNGHRVAFASNAKQHTLRGLHFRAQPHVEAKFVTCSRGSIFDVVVDADSRQWRAVTIRPGVGLYIPPGLAHGYFTLEDDTDVVYLLSGPTPPDSSRRGLRWDDPSLGIKWPAQPSALSPADQNWSWL